MTNSGAASAHEACATDENSICVTFAKSNVTACWSPLKGTLLDLAEERGLNPKNGCRSGMCGVCAVGILVGEVKYIRPTLAEPVPGTVLICMGVPKLPDELSGTGRRLLILDA